MTPDPANPSTDSPLSAGFDDPDSPNYDALASMIEHWGPARHVHMKLEGSK